MKITIDNTRRSGNFFDNLLNDNYLVHEIDVDNIDDININDLYNEFNISSLSDVKITTENDIIAEDNIDVIKENNTAKYVYIDDEYIENHKNEEFEKLFKKTKGQLFKLSYKQYKTFIKFCTKHHNCLHDKDNKSRFGAIGGGITLSFIVDYNPKFIFDSFDLIAKCEYCNNEENINENLVKTTDKKTYKKYENISQYLYKLDKVEFYRFMTIYNEYKMPLIIEFMPTGLGDLKTVRLKDKNIKFYITNIDNW